MASLKSQASKGINITPLTPIDHLMPRTYVIGMIFGFRLSRRANPLEIYEHLKSDLEATIDEIPFIGGRIAPVEGSPGRYQIETEPSKGDTRLIYNDIRSQSQKPWPQSYKSLSAGKFSVELLDIDVLSPVREYCQLDKPPVMSAQANFIDGGLILHVCTIHTACDVLATYNVLAVWSSKVRASWLEESEESPSPISPASFDRSPLMHGNHEVKRMDVREFRLQQESSGLVHPRDFLIDPTTSMSDMQLTIFSISKTKLAGLRDSVSAASSSGTWVTQNDALAAFIWDRINHVRYRKSESERPLTGNLVVAMDGRLRLNSPLPLTYMGNASLAFPIRLPLHPKSISSATNDIQKSMVEFNDRHLKDTIGYLDSLGGNLTEERLSYARTLDPTLVISNLKDMNYYSLDWGAGLGFVDDVRPAQNFGDCLPRIIPMPARRDGAVDIMVWIERTAMARLKVDPEWCKWVV